MRIYNPRNCKIMEWSLSSSFCRRRASTRLPRRLEWASSEFSRKRRRRSGKRWHRALAEQSKRKERLAKAFLSEPVRTHRFNLLLNFLVLLSHLLFLLLAELFLLIISLRASHGVEELPTSAGSQQVIGSFQAVETRNSC